MSEDDVADNDMPGALPAGNDDVQGDVLPGFRSRRHQVFHQRFLMARIAGEQDLARAGLRALLARKMISSRREVAATRMSEPPRAFVNIAFSALGMEQLGHPIADAAFCAGLADRSTERNLLGDPGGWEIGGPGSTIAVVLNVGSRDEALVERTADRVRDLLGAAYSFVDPVDGSLLPEGREHFGFRDGLAQPHVTDDPGAGRPPGAGATWPNWTALALRGQVEQASVRVEEARDRLTDAEADKQRIRTLASVSSGPRQAELLAAAEAARVRAAAEVTAAVDALGKVREESDRESRKVVDVYRTGAPIRPTTQFLVGGDDEITRGGSFMVWVKLEQHPDEFWALCRGLARRATERFGRAVDDREAAAWLVGRGVDGEPLEPHPPAAPEEFSYFADRNGLTCPAGSHVRLANPRDVDTAGTMILRRGLPYGPLMADRTVPDGRPRGLIFVCYQADIATQYERIQGEFANAGYRDGQPTSRFPDALISQTGREGSTVEIARADHGGSVGVRLNNTWVVPRGGLYLFVPSMTALAAMGRAGR